MTYFSRESLAPVDTLRDSAEVLGSYATETFPSAELGTYFWKLESPIIGQQLALLSDVSVVDFGNSDAIIQNVSGLVDINVYQVFQSNDGSTTLVDISNNFNIETDAVLGRQFPNALNNSSFITVEVGEGRSTEGYLNEFYVGATGNSGYFDAVYDGLDAPNDGRFLITNGTLAGKRNEAWGSWLDTIIFPFEPEPPIDPTVPELPESPIPDEAFWESSDSGEASSPLISFDESSGQWSVPGYEAGKEGAEWLYATTKEEIIEKSVGAFWSGARDFANDLGEKFGLRNLGNQIEDAKELYDTVVNYHTNMLDSISKGFDAVSGKSELSYDEYWEKVENDSNTFIKNLRDISDPKVSPAIESIRLGIFEVNSFKLKMDSGDATFEGGNLSDALFGGELNDIIHGRRGNDLLWGGGGSDTLLGGSGADQINGSTGNDNLFGGLGNDRLLGGLGNDWLNGGAGNDTLNGGAGRDWVSFQGESRAARVDLALTGPQATGHGRDVILNIENVHGGAGNDILLGNAQANLIRGGFGGDRILGRQGNDRLEGNAGADFLDGGLGRDVLIGGVGNDQLKGGAGNDTFIFRSGFDRDVILDFQNNIDTIRLLDFEVANFAQARSYAAQSGSNVVFDFDNGDILIVRNTTINALGDDLLFV